MKGYDVLLTFTDVGRQQARNYLRNLIVRWAAIELNRWENDSAAEPFPRDYDELKDSPFIRGVKLYHEFFTHLLVALDHIYRDYDELEEPSFNRGVRAYYDSFSRLLVALDRMYRDFVETDEAWNLVKVVIRQHLVERRCFIDSSGTSTRSPTQRAAELVKMSETTFTFVPRHVNGCGCIETAGSPVWLRRSIKKAYEAKHKAIVTSYMTPNRFLVPCSQGSFRHHPLRPRARRHAPDRLEEIVWGQQERVSERPAGLR